MGRTDRTRRRIGAIVAACALAAAPSAMANTYGSPGTVTDADVSGGGLGQSVSICADGTLAVVGEPNADGGNGAALVYANPDSDGHWRFVQRLTPTGETGAGHFGAAVSMDPGGETLIVGAPEDNGGVGTAWAFGLSGGVWRQQGQLNAGGAQPGVGSFGSSVAVANGGTIALVGAPTWDHAKGQAFTFYYGINPYDDYKLEWYYHQRMDTLGGGVSAGAHFGTSVAMSSNGGSADVGAPDQDWGQGAAGAVFPYGHWLGNPNWTTDIPPIHSPAPGSRFGARLAVSRGAELIFIGAPLASAGQGAVYEYWPNGTLAGRLEDPNPSAAGHFGTGLAVAGTTMDHLLVGAPGDSAGAGAAYEFDSVNGVTFQTPGSALSPADAPLADDAYGSSVAIAADGSQAIVGSPGAGSADGALTPFVSVNITVPDAPWMVRAEPGDGNAQVTWVAPDRTGGAPISAYTVTSDPDGLTCTSANEFGCTVSGLTNGRSYTFTVTATNHVGTGPASQPSDPVTPVAPADPGGGGDGSGGGGGGSTGGGDGSPVDGSGGGSATGGTTNGGSITGGSTGGGSTGGGSTGGAFGLGSASGGSGGTVVNRDTTPPSMPLGSLRVSRRTRTSITISWGPARDNTGVAGYRVYESLRGAWRLVGSAGLRRTFVRAGLRHRTRHRLAVRAYDGAGNLSLPLIGAWATTR